MLLQWGRQIVNISNMHSDSLSHISLFFNRKGISFFFCLSLNFNKIYHNVRILKYIIAHLLIYTKVLFVSHIRAQAFPDYTKLLMWIYVFFFCFFFCKTLCLLKIVLSLLDTCPYKNIYYAHRYQYKNCMLRTDNSLK